MIEDKFFVYDEEDLEYHEIKGHIIVSKSLTLFLIIVFIFMIFFSFATISKYLEAKSNEKKSEKDIEPYHFNLDYRY